MAPQLNESTTIELNVKDDYTFKATGSRVIFPGFSTVYEDAKRGCTSITCFKKNDAAHTVEVLPEQHFTQPPSTLLRGESYQDIRRTRHWSP